MYLSISTYVYVNIYMNCTNIDIYIYIYIFIYVILVLNIYHILVRFILHLNSNTKLNLKWKRKNQKEKINYIPRSLLWLTKTKVSAILQRFGGQQFVFFFITTVNQSTVYISAKMFYRSTHQHLVSSSMNSPYSYLSIEEQVSMYHAENRLMATVPLVIVISFFLLISTIFLNI